MTDFLPGFNVEDKKGPQTVPTLISNEGAPVFTINGENFVRLSTDAETPRLTIDGETPTDASGGNCSISNRTIPRAFNAFAFRTRQFVAGLSPQRRAGIGRRPRFYRIPWLRRADEPDDDFLP